MENYIKSVSNYPLIPVLITINDKKFLQSFSHNNNNNKKKNNNN